MELAVTKALGYERRVLISSEMAVSLGFREIAPFHIHATSALR